MLLVIIKGKKFVYNIGCNTPEINMQKLHKVIEKAYLEK